MPYPNYREKHQWEALVTPEKNAEYKEARGADDADAPDGVVLCYSRRLMDYFTETYDGRTVDRYYGDLHVLDATGGSVGVMGNFGIGAPTTAIMMDELVVDGVEAFLSIGFAGCLDDGVEMGEFVVCDSAVRDEGTSYHYAADETYAYPTDALVDEITRLLAERGDPFHVGPSWTTDAIYRETVEEVERYADEGVLTVEMEASAVFAVAARRGVDAGATFVVSDYLGPSDWEPKFHLTTEDVQRLGDTAVDVLERYVA
jgi:uridine phosphorylase